MRKISIVILLAITTAMVFSFAPLSKPTEVKEAKRLTSVKGCFLTASERNAWKAGAILGAGSGYVSDRSWDAAPCAECPQEYCAEVKFNTIGSN